MLGRIDKIILIPLAIIIVLTQLIVGLWDPVKQSITEKDFKPVLTTITTSVFAIDENINKEVKLAEASNQRDETSGESWHLILATAHLFIPIILLYKGIRWVQLGQFNSAPIRAFLIFSAMGIGIIISYFVTKNYFPEWKPFIGIKSLINYVNVRFIQ